MARKKRGKRPSAYDRSIKEVSEILADVMGIGWLDISGNPFSGIVIHPRRSTTGSDHQALSGIGIASGDPDNPIVRTELDDLGTIVAIPKETASPRAARAHIVTAVYTPARLLEECRDVLNEMIATSSIPADRRARRVIYEAEGRLRRAGVAETRELTKRGAQPREHGPKTLLDVTGRIWPGLTKMVAGRPYASTTRTQDGQTVFTEKPLFSPTEVQEARAAVGADRRIIHATLSERAARRLYGKAWGERMRAERPTVLAFLDEYNGEAPFLKGMAALVRRGLALSEAQMARVEDAMARHAEEERASGQFQRADRGRQIDGARPELIEFLKHYEGPGEFLSRMAAHVRTRTPLSSNQIAAAEDAMAHHLDRQIEGAAWLSHMREERPEMVEFLETYRGRSTFLNSVVCRLRAGLPLSDAQMAGVEDAMIQRNIGVPTAKQERMRVYATVESCETYEAQAYGFPGRTVRKQRAVLRTEAGRKLVAKATAFSGEPGERVHLSLTKTGEKRYGGDEPEIHVSRLFRLDEDGKVIKGTRARAPRSTRKRPRP